MTAFRNYLSSIRVPAARWLALALLIPPGLSVRAQSPDDSEAPAKSPLAAQLAGKITAAKESLIQAEAAKEAEAARAAAAAAPLSTPVPLETAAKLIVTPRTIDPVRQLLGVRVRSEGPTLRVIFLFDKAAPYSLKFDAAAKRATIDLIHTQVSFLPPEVSRIDDPRLQGIWIKRVDPAMATLELRLASTETHIEHFSLSDPAALVIDITRTDSPATVIGGPRISATLASAPKVDLGLVRAGGAVVPTAWLNSGTQASASSSSPTQAAVSPPNDSKPTSSGQTIRKIESADASELGPRAEDFDGFPIESIHAGSALAREMLDDFQGKRWGGALDKGLSYLKNNPISQESVDVLYMLAEARWQMGKLAVDPPLGEMTNFYEQALRAHDGGELGAFAHSRLAQARAQAEDPKGALIQIEPALSVASDPQYIRLTMLKARELLALARRDEALQLLEALGKRDLDSNQRLEIAKLNGAIHLDAGDAEGAWKSYAEASAIDPNWTALDYDNWEKLARAGLGTGHYNEALTAVQDLLSNSDRRDRSDNYRLLLLHAELLEKLGDTDIAEKTYETYLGEFGKSMTGATIQREGRDRFPVEVLQSESNYCMILWKEGKFAQAMAELHKTHELCLREGIDPAPLKPIVQRILPDFMRSQLDEDQPFEAVQAWRLYRHLVTDAEPRAQSLTALGIALERLGLYKEALDVLDQDTAGRKTADWTLRKARLLSHQGEEKQALALVENPLPAPSTEAQQADADFLLAKAYEAENRPLEAAQAYQAVLNEPQADPAQRGEGAVQAGLIFLKQKMPLAATELGVKALMIESDSLKAKKPSWDASTGSALRLMLARGFYERGDIERADILLQDYLAGSGDRSPDDTAIARLLSAQCQQRLGKRDEAASTLDAMLKEKSTPQVYADEARQMQKLNAWDKDHPQWPVLTEPETLKSKEKKSAAAPSQAAATP